MTEPQMRFNDGAGYERMMTPWTQSAGRIFLDWLAPAPNLKWLDVGCGNGAFTEILVKRCAPSGIDGIDPSEAQLAFARTRPVAAVAKFRQGDAMAVPYAAGSFDAAVMALVIFFVPDRAKGVSEMARVVRPGGSVSAYAWDVVGGGLPISAFHVEMRALDAKYPLPPSFEASRIEALRALWADAGLEAIETRQIVVSRTFADFEDFWTTNLLAAGLAQAIAAMPGADVERLKARL